MGEGEVVLTYAALSIGVFVLLIFVVVVVVWGRFRGIDEVRIGFVEVE